MLDLLLTPLKIKEGNIKAFEALFRLYYSPLCSFVMKIIGSDEAAEEIVEELFYKLWRDRTQLNIIYSIKSYLYKAARNEALQYLEHLEVKERYQSKALAETDESCYDGAQEKMEYEELEAVMNKGLEKLPERCGKIFKMQRFNGMKYKEIASQLSISVKTVEAEMSKALKILKHELDNYNTR